MDTKILSLNISEARDELKKINDALGKKLLDEPDFYPKLREAYHHLNGVWNVRNVTTAQFRDMSEKEFEGKFPL